MELLKYRFIPGACRACGARPLVRDRWCKCSDPMCPLSLQRNTVNLWPRRRVIDVRATFLEIGKLSAEGVLLLAAIVSVGVALLLVTGCGKQPESAVPAAGQISSVLGSVEIAKDTATGCEYLVHWEGGITPRMTAGGEHMCTGEGAR